MMRSSDTSLGGKADEAASPALKPAAARAIAEAEERRKREAEVRPTERGGRGGLDPVRFGDWEVKGITSDF